MIRLKVRNHLLKPFLFYCSTLTGKIYLLVINYHFGVSGKGSLAEKQAVLENAKMLTTQKSDGLPYRTRLKIGAEYFVTRNIEV